MKDLTKRQKEIFGFIREYIRAHRYPPTVREVACQFRISVKGSHDHIRALKKKQYIKCDLNRPRTLEIIKESEGSREAVTTSIPILGTVAAGKPLFAEENFDGMVEVPECNLGNGEHFALHVKGDSMKNAGILDGDIAVIIHRNVAENGDIVVAMIDDSVTLKRLVIEKNRFKLKAENESYPAIYARDLRILGKLVYIMRKYE
jgi:repressor LexA